ncbi:MAG: spermidine synthase [Holophagales bacterium]|nr:spermidine synthase [Holophagales bacterium]
MSPPADPRPPGLLAPDALVRRLAFVLFVSGFCSLVYQVAWFRLARQVFGASTASTSAVVAIFMGGLGLGAALFGRRIARVAQPLQLYAGLEAAIALTAGLTPITIGLVQWIYIGLGGVQAMGDAGALAIRLVLATIVLGIPTTLMGGTLPVMAHALEVDRDRGRRLVAWLYGINTLGAVTGALVASFATIELLGIRKTIWLAAAVNLLLPIAVRSWARRSEPRLGEDAPSRPAPATAPSGTRALPVPVLLVLAALVGFVFFLMEIVWYRLLGPLLGGTSYTFGLILAMALVGIGFGSLVYALGARSRRPTIHALALSLALEGFFMVVPFALGDRLAFFASVLRDLSATGFSGLVLSWTIVAAVVVVPAAAVAGYQFPLLVGLLGAGADRVGQHVGRVYAFNTAGSILGSLAGGFGLLPLLGAVRLWWGASALLAVAGLALAVHGLSARRLRALPTLALAGITLALCAADGPTAFWRQSAIGAGRLTHFAGTPNDLTGVINKWRLSLIEEIEGVESNVALVSHTQLALIVNGKSDGAAVADAPTVVMSSLVGAILHPNPKRGLVIGLGTGSSAGWLAEVESIERVDVVELEPAVVSFLPAFAPVNRAAHASEKIDLAIGDGRELVLTTSESYDVVFSEPSNPYRAGVADLFSRDFYEGVEKRLAPGGIFLQWLQLYDVEPSVLQSALATISSVFPSVETWIVNSADLLLVASREPLLHDADLLAERVMQEPYRSALRDTWGVEGLEGLYTGYVAGPELASTLGRSDRSVISTDDRPVLEFGFVRSLGSSSGVADDLLRSAAELGLTRPPIPEGALSWERVEELREVRTLQGYYPDRDGPKGEARRTRLNARTAWLRGQVAHAYTLWQRQEAPPLVPLDRLLIAEGAALTGDPEAESLIESIRDEHPVEADLLLARLLALRGQPKAALERLTSGFETMRTHAWFEISAARRGFDLAQELAATNPSYARRLYDQLGEPFAVYVLDIERLKRRVEMALASRDPALCAEALESFEPHVEWSKTFLRGRMRCYQATGHPLAARAEVDLGRFLAYSAPDLDVSAAVAGDDAAPHVAP